MGQEGWHSARYSTSGDEQEVQVFGVVVQDKQEESQG